MPSGRVGSLRFIPTEDSGARFLFVHTRNHPAIRKHINCDYHNLLRYTVRVYTYIDIGHVYTCTRVHVCLRAPRALAAYTTSLQRPALHGCMVYGLCLLWSWCWCAYLGLYDTWSAVSSVIKSPASSPVPEIRRVWTQSRQRPCARVRSSTSIVGIYPTPDVRLGLCAHSTHVKSTPYVCSGVREEMFK
jgi:hypothetical protein